MTNEQAGEQEALNEAIGAMVMASSRYHRVRHGETDWRTCKLAPCEINAKIMADHNARLTIADAAQDGEWRVVTHYLDANQTRIAKSFLVRHGHVPGLVHKALESVLTVEPMQPSELQAFANYLNALTSALTAVQEATRRAEAERDEAVRERDDYKGDADTLDDLYHSALDRVQVQGARAEAAEARVRALEAALRDIEHDWHHSPSARVAARNALSPTADQPEPEGS